MHLHNNVCYDDNKSTVTNTLKSTTSPLRKGEDLLNATFFQRLKAFFIDYIFILIYLGVILVINLLFPSVQKLFNSHSLIVAQFFGFLLVTLPVSLYFILSDSVVGKQSFGKKVLKIRVVNQQGLPPTLSHALLRTAIKFIPWELSHFLIYRLVNLGNQEVPLHLTLIGILIYALMFAYILTAIFTRKKQSLYDMIVKTRVEKYDGEHP